MFVCESHPHAIEHFVDLRPLETDLVREWDRLRPVNDLVKLIEQPNQVGRSVV
jgi:hypothetical protein